MGNNFSEKFGSMVFNEDAMKQWLPLEVYSQLKDAVLLGTPVNPDTADIIAEGMKNWALEKGATHYTHWFQPLTGVTAEKHDSFISQKNGRAILEFSGKALFKGESDASSFPSGGLRATFEARGYTTWDPSSYTFVKDNTLYIPTAFCSYSGETLDNKTPLLKSMEALNKQVMRILRLFGDNETEHVFATMGAEQEYFLIDEAVFKQRPDLVYCNRMLFGAKPTRGQELGDHYLGSIKPRVSKFMADLDNELWKLGVLAKTEHNEAAPAQHELAPLFTTLNIAADHNQLTMDLMKTIASRHGLVCVLHEKPFQGVNGSGKHNNWSISTDSGENLFDPGKTPSQNARFLLFLAAAIKAVDEHQDLLRVSVASAANDLRLGGHEAPPAIISMFLGDDLTAILEAICSGLPYEEKNAEPMTIGASVLPPLSRDTTDRNRTSPCAFTGNKFEFRMPGSSQSVAAFNVVINTIMADSLKEFADALENSDDFQADLNVLIKKTLTEHNRIVFDGNNYSEEWIKEAEKRGLLNLSTTADALKYFDREDNIALFARHKVYSRSELTSRREILTENYCNTLHIEALTMIEMVKQGVLPAIIKWEGIVAKSIWYINQALELPESTEKNHLKTINLLLSDTKKGLDDLEKALCEAENQKDNDVKAMKYKNKVIEAMRALGNKVDNAEMIMPKDIWPYPSSGDILYSVS